MPRWGPPWSYNVPYGWGNRGATSGTQLATLARHWRPSPERNPGLRDRAARALGMSGAAIGRNRGWAAVATQSCAATATADTRRENAGSGGPGSGTGAGEIGRANGGAAGQAGRRPFPGGARECAAWPAVYAPPPALGDAQFLPNSGAPRPEGGAFLFHPAQLWGRSVPRERGPAPLPSLAPRPIRRGAGRRAAASLAAGAAILAGIPSSGAARQEGQRHSQGSAQASRLRRQTFPASLGSARGCALASGTWRFTRASRGGGAGAGFLPAAIRRYNSI
jgi:hypothetical protein